MKRILSYALIFLCGFGNTSNAQDLYKSGKPMKTNVSQADFPDFTDPAIANDSRCGTVPGVEHRVANDPRYANFYRAAREIPKQGNSRQLQIACDGNNTIVVPVAFHFANNAVTGNCAGEQCLLTEMQDQLDALNLAFGDNTGTTQEAACPAAYQDGNGNSVASTGTCIVFCLAIPPTGNAEGLDPACDPPITIGSFTGGLNGGGNGAPGWGGILNIFITNGNCLGVADGIPGAGNGDGVTVCSEAFGGFDGPAGCNLDDNNTFGLGATLVHEVGHYLGLYHVWGDGGCGATDANPPGPINVDDTPDASGSSGGCPTACQSTCGTPNPWANFMDYTDDACMSMFTEDQAAVMNYWANQLFGATASQCSNPNPTQLTTVCQAQSCVLVCPAAVTTPLNITEDICAGIGTYTLPVNPTSVGLVVDEASDAVYSWSTGNYLSAGGVAATSPVALTSPAGCAPVALVLYLNVDCGTTPLGTTLDGGTVTLNVYPDPAQLSVTDLVTVSGENTCGEPIITPIADCAGAVTIMADAGNPAFPVAAGVSGTANYTVTYNGMAGAPNCCLIDNGSGELVANGDLEAGTVSWTEIEEVPAGTPNPNPFGVIGVSNPPVINGTNDAWFGGWGQSSYIAMSQDITIPAGCTSVELTYDYITDCSNNTAMDFSVVIGGVTVSSQTCGVTTSTTVGPIDLIAAGVPTGNVTMLFQGTETISGGGQISASLYVDNISINALCQVDANCDFPVTASYACAAANYDFSITDPCTCNNDGNNVTADGTGTFNELVTVGSTTAGETWTVQAITGANGISVGDALTDNGATFDLMFTHNDGIGYTVTVEGPGAPGAAGNVTQTVSNICAYPQIAFAPAISICTDAASFSLSATETTAAVDGSFTYSPAGTIDPTTYAVGATETFIATYTGIDDGLMGVSADGVTPAYPACNESTSVGATFINCAPACNATMGTWND